MLLIPTPSRAAGVWDPDDKGGRLDIRWVGVYEQRNDDLSHLRVTMTFYEPIRARWLKILPVVDERAFVRLGRDQDDQPDLHAAFYYESGWWAVLCPGGGSCDPPIRADHPNDTTLRVRLRTPANEWTTFQGRSETPTDEKIDATRWGEIA